MLRPSRNHFPLATLLAIVLAGAGVLAQAVAQAPANPPGGSSGTASPSRAGAPQPKTSGASGLGQQGGEYRLRVNVNLVVLHATVLDKKGRMVNDLTQDNFRVYEDGVPQKLAVFSHADIPVTMGIVIDDSGSMREKRAAVNAAALTLVRTSNPQDQVFVVNFNDVYYLDTPGDFASNMEDLKAALSKIDSRGGTALYDAVYASLDHLKLGNRDKKVLVVITDGEDNASRYTFDELIQRARQSNAVIYCIGLLGEEQPGGLFKIGHGAHRGGKVLEKLAEATGGTAYFPKSLHEVDAICQQIAHDIRNQYTLAYYPSNTKRDGTFRTVRIEAFAPGSHSRLIVRSRPGYFAPRPEPSGVAASW
jgi:Ca-activated chloride channel family protein